MHKILKEGRPKVNTETSIGQHTEDIHNVMSGRITGDDRFHHHKLIFPE